MDADNFIDLSTDGAFGQALIFGVVAVIFIALVPILAASFWKKARCSKGFVGFVSGMSVAAIVALALTAGTLYTLASIRYDREDKVRAFLIERYEITVTDDQLKKITDGAYAAPGEYEPTTIDVEGNALEIYLRESTAKDDFYSVYTTIPLSTL